MAKDDRQHITDEHPETHYALRQQLGYKLSRLSYLMQQRLDADLADHDMTRQTWCVLSSVGFEGISTPSEVAVNLGITRPMLSRLVKSMTQDGLIRSELTNGDGRNRQLILTSKGEQKLAECYPKVQNNRAHFSSKLTEDQLGLFQGLVDVLLEDEEAEVEIL